MHSREQGQLNSIARLCLSRLTDDAVANMVRVDQVSLFRFVEVTAAYTSSTVMSLASSWYFLLLIVAVALLDQGRLLIHGRSGGPD